MFMHLYTHKYCRAYLFSRENFLSVSVFLRDLSYTEIVQHVAYDSNNLLGKYAFEDNAFKSGGRKDNKNSHINILCWSSYRYIYINIFIYIHIYIYLYIHTCALGEGI